MSLPGTLPEPTPASIDLDDDDRLIGRILSRREVLALIGAGGAAASSRRARRVATAVDPPPSAGRVGQRLRDRRRPRASAAIATALPACVVAPELTEGPYYVDVDLERSDIRTEHERRRACRGSDR